MLTLPLRPHPPRSRYLGGDEDHYSQRQDRVNDVGCVGVDLWDTDRPAYNQNGSYGSYIYNDEAIRVINGHDTTVDNPMFIYLALQVMHAPNQVPESYSAAYTRRGYVYPTIVGFAR